MKNACNHVENKRKIFSSQPDDLVKYGIQFQRVIQKMGNYVIVLPGASHSGINLGCNMATAFNHASNLRHAGYYLYRHCYNLSDAFLKLLDQ